MPRASRPQWQQATALITIGAGGVATGLTFVPKAAADLTSPASVPPMTLLAMEHANAPAPGRDAMLRAAIVHIARHFLRLADTRSPAEMEAMIWQYASTDGANHGPSCAAFASLTLELGSHIAGLDSWVTGGSSYPWPVHAWADGRVDPNPASPGVVSVLQDARAHGRWHPAGDGYTPQPGDWVLFDGHVEVVTKYHGGVLHTIGGDSLPNMSVNAHEYSGPLQDQGVAGFVDNGVGMSNGPTGPAHGGGERRHRERTAAIPGSQTPTAPTSSMDPSASAGKGRPGSAATASGGAASGRAASGGAAFGGAASGAAASGGSGSTGHRPSGGPGIAGDATGRQAELAPRAISAPPTVPRSRYAQESRALPAQGAGSAALGEDASGAGAAARSAQATRTTAEAHRPSAQPTGNAASRSGRAARPAGQHPQPAGQRPQRSSRSPQHADRRPQHGDRGPQRPDRRRAMTADVPATGLRPARPHHARRGEAAIPGLFKRAHEHHPGDVSGLPPYHRHDVPPSNAPQPGTASQQAFINEVAHGAMATQDRYGVPASVTIAQAIDESAWGQSLLATNDHNLFGIKGTGPAGSDEQPTQEVINGQVVNLSASFQIYENIAQSIDAHGRLLAHSGDYAGAMSQSKDPNAFAAALTGVYATDPSYGAKLIQLMKQYDLYRFNQAARGNAPAAHRSQPTRPDRSPVAKRHGGEQHAGRSAQPHADPGPHRKSPGHDRKPKGPVGNPVPVQPAPIAEPAPGQPAPIANPVPREPGPPAPAHDRTPAPATKPGASVAARKAGTPIPGQAADHTQAVQHDAVTPPTAVLYPGRSARPAPLAHPARPADLARPSGPAQGSVAEATATQARRPGRPSDPTPRTGHSGTHAEYGKPTGVAQPGSATEPGTATGQEPGTASSPGSGMGTAAGSGTRPGSDPRHTPDTGRGQPARRGLSTGAGSETGLVSAAGPGSGTGLRANTGLGSDTGPGSGKEAVSGTGQSPGMAPGHATGHGSGSGLDGANVSGDAAIPGVPHTAVPRAGHIHARRPIGRLRPAHPAARSTVRMSVDRPARPTAPGNTAGAGAQQPAARSDRPSHADAGPTRTPGADLPTAHAATVSQTGSAVIPGVQHHGLGAHADNGLSDATALVPDNPATASVSSGGSSIPGAQPGAVAGSVMRAPAHRAAAPGHARTATVPSGSSSIPGAQPEAHGGSVARVPASPATAPGNTATATATAGGTSIPGAQPAPSAGSAAEAPASPATAPGNAATATVTAGGTSIPGAQPEAGAGYRARPQASPATAAGNAATATVTAGSSSIPGIQPAASAGSAAEAPGRPARAPGNAATATVTAGGSSIPGAGAGSVSQTSAGPAAAPRHGPTPPSHMSMSPAARGATSGHVPESGHRVTAPGGTTTGPARQPTPGGAVSAPGHTALAPTTGPASRMPAPGPTSATPGYPAHALGDGGAPGRAATTPIRAAATPPTHTPAPGHAYAAPADPANRPGNAPAPGHAATAPSRAAATPSRTAPAPVGDGAGPGRPAAASSRAMPRGGTTRPSAARSSAGSAPPSRPSARPAPASANPAQAAARPVATATSRPVPGGAGVPGLVHGASAMARPAPAANLNGGSATMAGPGGNSPRVPGRSPANGAAPGATLTVYHAHMPPSVREAFVKSAKTPLVRSEPLYRDVASHTGIRWELLAACDWMQCKARHGYSPVYGERLGALNPDDTCYRTKSAALEQCASDLVQLARSVYQLDIATSHELSVRDLASVFAAFRWGGLLRQHFTSAMDFPYSVAGLTADHTHMRWPNIDEPNAPDKPGSRFRQPFGAVPVVLGLNYQALM